jgi:hypothetical protein
MSNVMKLDQNGLKQQLSSLEDLMQTSKIDESLSAD